MKKLAIIGAGEFQVPLIRKARELGFETHVFAWQTGREAGELTADHFYPISSEEKELILEKCREQQVSAVVSLGSDMAALATAYVCEAMRLPSNSYSSVVCATNKLITRNLFSKIGISQPAYVEIGSVIPTELLSRLRYPLIVKPSDRSGCRGLAKVEDERQLFYAINAAREISIERKAIVEEYIDGQLYSCECVSCEGEHRVLGYTKRGVFYSQGRICECTYSQPAYLAASLQAEMRELSVRALNALGIRSGASSIEFIVDHQRNIHIIEVTPSMYGDFIGTHLVPDVTGYDYLRMIIDIACGKVPDFTVRHCACQEDAVFVYSAGQLEEMKRIPPEQLVESRVEEERYIPQEPDGMRYGFYITRRSHKEFGGCMPLQLGLSDQMQPFPKEHLLALNSEYTALWCAVKQLRPKRLLMPYYVSQQMERIVRELDVEISPYHLDERMLPVGLEQGSDDAVLLVNYHDRCRAYIDAYAREHSRVIIDHTMAFYAPPVMKQDVFNIYSCRKFFAVPDGAYLVSSSLPHVDLERDVSYKRGRALLMALELGPGAAYKEQQTNEQSLAQERKTMSVLTEKMMSALDVDRERQARRANFEALDRLLSPYQLFPLGTGYDAVPQCYPLLVNADIRTALISHKIYVPVMWRRFLTEQFEGKCEKLFSQKLLLLPIDPIYSINDMAYVAKTITALLT